MKLPDETLAAAERLTEGLEPPAHRMILIECLSGTMSPPVALMKLLIDTEDAASVRGTIDEVTRRAALLSRGTDNILRDKADELTQLVFENGPGCEKIAEMLRANVDSPEQAPSVGEGIRFCERLFDWSVQQSEEASVALYSLGNPELLERATEEIVLQLAAWKVISPEALVLDIGCGIGRLTYALSSRVAGVSGVDLSAKMIEAAKRRCAQLENIVLFKSDGRDLGMFNASSFNTAIAVDTFPYLNQSGELLVSSYFAEVSRVLRTLGDFVIFNFSYRGDDRSDRAAVASLAMTHGFEVVLSGERPFGLWDGVAFHLRKAG